MNNTNKTMVQVYDKEVVKEYYKILPHAFWSSEELIDTLQMENAVVVSVDTDKPIRVLVNGEEYIKK